MKTKINGGRYRNMIISSILLLIMAIAAPIGSSQLNSLSNTSFSIIIGIGLLLLVSILDIFLGITLRNIFVSVNQIYANISMFIRVIYGVYLFILVMVLYVLPNDYNNKFTIFSNIWSYGLFVFGIHLLILGFLIYKSKFLSKILGVLVVISGFGYMFDTIIKLFVPGINFEFSIYTFIGEALLIFWLPIHVITHKKKLPNN